MKCIVCKQGQTSPGAATVTLARGTTTLVMKDVPAEVCDVCGEEYVDEDVTARIIATAEEAAAASVEVSVRRYVA